MKSRSSVLPREAAPRGVNVFCGPLGLPGEGDHLFHNNGDGTFTDITVKAGVSDPFGYYGLASVFVDVDDDGWVDLVVANDSVPNYLYRNRHDGTFEDVSFASGLGLSGDGREQASMGIGVGDYNRDGRVDFFISTFSDDYKTLYRNEGEGSFSDATFEAGLVEPTIPFLSWGNGLLDFDNDGLLDVFLANGHVYIGVDSLDWGTTWAQRPQLFRNLDGKHFREVAAATGSGLAAVIPARGAAFGDLFNDGHIDVVINNMDAAPTLLRNVVKNGNHWITLKLVGGPKSPRDAIGAKVFVTAGGVRQRADVYSGASYGSSSDPRVHFGLGVSSKVEKVEIHWPSGTSRTLRFRLWTGFSPWSKARAWRTSPSHRRSEQRETGTLLTIAQCFKSNTFADFIEPNQFNSDQKSLPEERQRFAPGGVSRLRKNFWWAQNATTGAEARADSGGFTRR